MKKRIETKEYRTAEVTCLARAMSFYEKNKILKSEDFIAPMILPPLFKMLLKSNIIRTLFKKVFFHFGIYEYVIARTKYIDEIFKSIKDDFKQILIFGAGFDSRAIRFNNNLKDLTVFELDTPATQIAKINQFKKQGIEFSTNLKFISIDFEKETLNQKLEKSGFKKYETCLFLLEGLTMYLDPKSIDITFSTIKEFAGHNSLIIFDYVYSSVITGESNSYGVKGIRKWVKKYGEKWVFDIEKGQIQEFLNRYDFELVDESDYNKLSDKFFKDQNGNNKTKINGAHCIITARKK